MRLRCAIAVLAACAGLAGCSGTLMAGAIGATMELAGLKKPDLPAADVTAAMAAVPKPKKVSLRIHAGSQLNTDPQGRSLSLVVRLYKLKSANAFLAAPYKAFGSTEGERAAFGNDLVDVRELVLSPGQKHEVVETLPLEATHLAVAALFRAPAEGRWRFAFEAKDAEKTGITVGLHGCAMSVAAGTPEGAQPEMLRLAGVSCLSPSDPR
ncbi:type VI secretion system lipoprotein TssJ [Pseudorhodoferax sp.]|uniref:type VI secretion system lipoprotein TssJ n=1 Tax=Pseudorhodoferax sp. TaxID=1993553 RepID=UPI0039E61A70